jgi:D-arabinose 1-dehydrogenase-like Zn-dependent alcohol dehydrogenase
MKSQAITAFGKPLEEVTGEVPQPQGAEVVLKVTHCGVCHSDIHIHDGYFDMGGGNKLDMTRGIQLPFTLGHEIEGEVVAVGPDAGEAKVGDRRVAFPWIGCGQCPICARGDEHLCNAPRQLGVNIAGGYADHVLVPHEKYLLDYDGIPEGLAATYMCSGLTAFSALKKIGEPGPEDAVLIVGAGGVGMAGVQFAKALFDAAPLVADISAEKLAAAQQAGAGKTYDASDAKIVKQIKADTGGGVFAAIDFVGSESSFALARNSLRKGGTAVVVGLFGGAFTMPIPMFPFTSMQLKGSFVGSLAETREMLELVKRGAVDPIPVAERPLDQANATLDDLRAGKIVGRVVLRP